MGYYRVVRGQNGAREETFSPEQRGAVTGHGQEAVQPAPGTSLLQRRRRLPHLTQVAIIALLILILVGASVLVALFTYWIGH